MGVPKPKHLYTEKEYLDFERASEVRHEFLDGEIFAIAGRALSSQLHRDESFHFRGIAVKRYDLFCGEQRYKDSQCSDIACRQERQGSVFYPEIVVVCGEPEYTDNLRDVILNPKVIFEILSPPTEAFDRGEKCDRYQTWNTSLTDYLLVAQAKPVIEHFRRKKDGSWTFRRFVGLDATCSITSIHCVLKLAGVYNRVAFDES